MNLVTLFSGIGAPEQALKKSGISFKTILACDNGEIELNEKLTKDLYEIVEGNHPSDTKKILVEKLYSKTGKINHVRHSYESNYTVENNNFHLDVRAVNYDDLPNDERVDILVGGSPCQSFSISGKRQGLDDTRGTLFYEYARLVGEFRPKIFVYENVPGILSHDNGNTWLTISNVFDDLGYNWSFEIINSKDFDIPQNRKRVFVVGVRNDLAGSFSFPIKRKLTKIVSDYLDEHNNVDQKYYHREKGFKWITAEKSLKKRVSINRDISRTQAANQQFNWCGDMVFIEKCNVKDDIIISNAYLGKFNEVEGYARKLTPRECLRLMGFPDSFKIVVSDKEMYRQSGNSIVVNVLSAIFDNILQLGVFENE